ncbi:MAG: signal peptidase II [Armatimonadota bacterium]|nr:signal peptidase II [Armatimonadota bacterium]
MKRKAFYAIALAVAIIDQSAKLLVLSHLKPGNSIPLVGGIILLEPTCNPGGAFGIFQAYGGIITFLTALVIIGILVASRQSLELPRIAWIALALQLGGAIGNIIDRIRFGYVLDFINLKVWPVFNLADAAITIGILLLVFYVILSGKFGANNAS